MPWETWGSCNNLVPCGGAPNSLIERCVELESKTLLRPPDVQLAPRLDVGLGCVPDDAPFEAGEAGDGLQQIFDADPSHSLRARLERAADVDGSDSS